MDLEPASRPTTSHLLAAVGVVVIIHVVVLVSAYPVVGAVLFLPLLGIPVALLTIAFLIFASAGVLRAVTGRWRVGAALLGGLATCVAYLAIVMRAGGLPVAWFPALSLDLGSVAAGVIGGLITALLLPRWPLRILGGVTAVAALAFFALPPTWDAIAQRQADERAAAEAAEEAAEAFLRSVTRPVVSDAEGMRVIQTAAGEYISTVRIETADAGVMDIETVPDSPDTDREELACWLMVQDVGALDDSITMEHYAGICTWDGAGRWETTDGRAIAVRFEDRLVIVRTPHPEFPAAEGSRDATTAELEDAVRHLRLTSLDELRQLLEDTGPEAGLR